MLWRISTASTLRVPQVGAQPLLCRIGAPTRQACVRAELCGCFDIGKQVLLLLLLLTSDPMHVPSGAVEDRRTAFMDFICR